MKEFIGPVLHLAKYSLSTHNEDKDSDLYEEFSDDENKPLLMHAKRFMNPAVFNNFNEITQEVPPHLFERSTSMETQNWMDEFRAMKLPIFSVQYIQLVHVPLDVMRECLKLQMELGKDVQSPSAHTVKQVMCV